MADQHIFDGEDIHSECKRALEALRESEEKLRVMFESTREGIAITDLKGKILDVNDAILRMSGLSREELIGQEGFGLVPPEDGKKIVEQGMKAIKSETGTEKMSQETTPTSGRIYDADLSVGVLRNNSGDPTGFVAIVRDITERKWVEEALRYSEQHFRALIENAMDAIVVVNPDATIRYESPSMNRLLGYKIEDRIGKNSLEFCHPDDILNIMEPFIQLLENRVPVIYTEMRLRHKNHRWCDFEVVGTNLIDNPAVGGIVLNLHDITERKRANEASRMSDNRYQLLAENVTDIIWTMDMNLQFTYLSPSIRRLGYSVEKAVALSLDRVMTLDSLNLAKEVFTEEMAVEELDRRRQEGAISSQEVLNLLTPGQRDSISDITVDEWLIQRKVPWSKHRMRILEVELYREDGSTEWVELAVGFLRNSDGKPVGIVGIARDVSERKKAEEEKLLAVMEKAAVLDSMGEGLLIISIEGKVISCNPAFEKLCCYTESELRDKDAGNLIDVLVKAEDRQRLIESFAAALKGGIVGTAYFTLISGDGREIPVATAETKVVDEEGNPTSIIVTFKDITHMKQAEADLRESEEKLRRFMNSATDQFTIWDSELNLVDLNEAALKYPLIRHSGESNKEDFIGKNIVELEPHIKERGRYEQYMEVIKSGESLLIEDAISNPNLGDIHLSVKAFKVGDGLGMITTDITESKRAERTLRDSEQRYRLLADNVTDIITITDLNLQLIYISPSIQRLLGYSVEEAMTKTMEHFLTPASLDAAMEALAEEIATRNKKEKYLFWTRTLEMEMTCKDGSTVWTENIVSPLRDQNNKVIGIVGVTRDIGERKRAEVALRESEEKLRSFMDSATDFFTIWDSELNLIDLNEASLKYPTIDHSNGVKKEDFFGRNILELDPDIEGRGIYDEYLEVIRTGKPFFTEDVVCHPKLGDVYLSVRAFKVGDGLGLLTMDMTDRKRAEDAIRQAEKLRALGEMAGGVAHDFNNILSVVLGRAQLALADVKDEKARRSIEIIEQTALDAAAMVRRLREVAVVKGERSFDEIDLNKLMEDTIQMVESRRLELNETEGVTIEIHSERNEVAPASGDAAELREAVVNLLFNAMDAMPEGGSITMESRQEDGSVVLSVIDTGVGIPEEIKGKLFDPFFSTKASKGSGLGLSVTMGIITKHGGSIDVESTQGEGTTFHIRLPMVNCVKNGSCSQSKKPTVKRTRILLVDDDPEVSDIIGLTLEHLGHEVMVATSGGEALDAFEKDNYGLVITDLGMPDVSGLDVARAVKAKKPNTPVMLITGWGVQVDPEQMSEVDSVIEKPFGKDSLLAQMAELLPVRNGKKAINR